MAGGFGSVRLLPAPPLVQRIRHTVGLTANSAVDVGGHNVLHTTCIPDRYCAEEAPANKGMHRDRGAMRAAH